MKRLLLILGIACTLQAQTHWIGTWGAAPAPQGDAAPKFSDQTLREIVHVSRGGSTIRVRLSNAFAAGDAEIGPAHIALRSSDSAIVPGTDRSVTFSGRASVRIPPGAVVLSDPVELTVPPSTDLAISLYFPGTVEAGGVHSGAQQTSWLAKGDMTGAPSLDRSPRSSLPGPF